MLIRKEGSVYVNHFDELRIVNIHLEDGIEDPGGWSDFGPDISLDLLNATSSHTLNNRQNPTLFRCNLSKPVENVRRCLRATGRQSEKF